MPRPGRCTLRKGICHPLYSRTGGPRSRFGLVRKISPPPRFDPGMAQPVPAHVFFYYLNKYWLFREWHNSFCLEDTLFILSRCLRRFRKLYISACTIFHNPFEYKAHTVLIAKLNKIMWYKMLWRPKLLHLVSRKAFSFVAFPEDGGSRLLRNVGTFIPVYTASCPRRF
jgi:hypothetical protein